MSRARRKRAGEGGEAPRSSRPTPISSSPALGRSGISPRSCWHGAISKLGTAPRRRAERDGKSPRPRHGGGRSRQAKASPAKPAKSRTRGASGKNSPAPRAEAGGRLTTERQKLARLCAPVARWYPGCMAKVDTKSSVRRVRSEFASLAEWDEWVNASCAAARRDAFRRCCVRQPGRSQPRPGCGGTGRARRASSG